MRIWFAVSLSLFLVLVVAAPALAALETGKYIGNGAPFVVTTSLNQIKVIRIYAVPLHGRGAMAYTNDTLQTLGAQGPFLNDGKKDVGVTLNGPQCQITNPDFISLDTVYIWEALDV